MILLEMSIMGAVLTGLITLIRKIAGQRLLPACYLAFWALAGSRFLLPIEIVSPFSVYNLFHRIKHTAAEVQYLAVPAFVCGIAAAGGSLCKTVARRTSFA